MLRVAYPAVFATELFEGFPENVELIPVSEQTEGVIDADVWIPDSNSRRSIPIWPRLRGVRLVLCTMAGTEWVPGLVGPHVTICNGRGAHNIPTAEWAVTATLASLKFFPFYDEVRSTGEWRRRKEANAQYVKFSGDTRPHYPPVMQEELTGKRVLLVGHGEIGKEIERMLEPFHVRLTRVARHERQEPMVHAIGELDRLLPEADVVLLILPLSETTRGLIGARQLALMHSGALLVNAARGPIVDTDALAAALQAGRIRAALDVTDPEPLPEGHPLWSCPNLLMTPHVAALTPEHTRRALRVIAGELQRYLNGEPLRNVVQEAI